MANVIKLRRGLDINLKGAAAQELVSVKEPGFYSLIPDDYTGITPKVVVKEQEYVMAGGPLFIDKNHPELKFVSPVSGVVTSVERGARRKVLNIVVEAAAEQGLRGVRQDGPVQDERTGSEGRIAASRYVRLYPSTSVRRNRRPDGDAESNLYLRFRQQPAGTRFRICSERGRS